MFGIGRVTHKSQISADSRTGDCKIQQIQSLD